MERKVNKIIARRSFLKAAAAAPLAAPVAAQQITSQLQTSALVGAGMSGSGPVVGSNKGPLKFVNFASWFKDVGKEALKEEARNFSRVDPDIIEMRLPLATKARMQRERGYKRLVEERKSWFSRSLKRDGKVEWWG